MLDMRRSEDAEGERRIIGSGRRLGFFGCVGRAGALLVACLGAPGLGFSFLRKSSAVFLTCEKSCHEVSVRFEIRKDQVGLPLA